jgi:recombination associated protein RdgC
VFKNVTIYRIAPGWEATLESMEAALDAARFVPCGASQDKSVGWAEPRGEEHGPLVESVAGQRILKLVIETKAVPGSVVKEKAQEAADHIEATTGRKPGKKETKELREDALQALLPQAFPRRGSVWVWFDLQNGLLVTDAGSQGKNDEVVTALVRAFDGLAVTLLQTAMTPQTAMTAWLATTDPENDWPAGFNVERECELKSADEEKSAVKFTRHHLLTDEVRKHLAEGKLPTRLALSWEGRVGFTLTESMQLKKLAFLEGVFDDRPGDDESGFDTDVALATGELSKLIPAVIEALGGEIVPGMALPDAPVAAPAKPKQEAVTAVGDGDAPF